MINWFGKGNISFKSEQRGINLDFTTNIFYTLCKWPQTLTQTWLNEYKTYIHLYCYCLTVDINPGPISKHYLSTWSHNTVVGCSIIRAEVPHGKAVHTGSFSIPSPLAAVVLTSREVNHLWSRMIRVFQPHDASVFCCTVASVNRTVESHRVSGLDWFRLWLLDDRVADHVCTLGK